MNRIGTMKKNDFIFWDKLARKYAKQPVPDQVAYEKKLELTRAYLTPDCRVLELGCGTGTTALIQAEFAGHITATDFSPGMIAIAKEKAAAQKVANVTFKVESAEVLPYEDDRFDVVMAHSLLHLVKDRALVLANIHRVLKPGGHFISSSVHLGEAYKWLKWVWPIAYFFGKFPYLRVFTRKDFLAEIASAGFDITYEWQQNNRNTFFVAKKM